MQFLSKFYDENLRFRNKNQIYKEICNFKNDYSNTNEEFKLLNIFSTSKQRTYLASKGDFVYCVLDDARKSSAKVVWAMPKKLFIEKNGKLKIRLNPRDKTENTGVIDFGSQHKNWLYSKHLFRKSSLEENIKKIIS
ncbi:hypothetical protein [Vibrio porteresiae]|uniref:Uncharacterized protein n=1 Tax=Vibrio porteresiae DSM 19223 TaxID=1123496 RepID=A0ABZ0QKA9_9VIBR|nr:hypothetical protein [Vibrio porteresiae]WPC75858.1 hypothetical protein R8Z52_23370 [Vibrio porteresiae DSM 19223]